MGDCWSSKRLKGERADMEAFVSRLKEGSHANSARPVITQFEPTLPQKSNPLINEYVYDSRIEDNYEDLKQPNDRSNSKSNDYCDTAMKIEETDTTVTPDTKSTPVPVVAKVAAVSVEDTKSGKIGCHQHSSRHLPIKGDQPKTPPARSDLREAEKEKDVVNKMNLKVASCQTPIKITKAPIISSCETSSRHSSKILARAPTKTFAKSQAKPRPSKLAVREMLKHDARFRNQRYRVGGPDVVSDWEYYTKNSRRKRPSDRLNERRPYGSACQLGPCASIFGLIG